MMIAEELGKFVWEVEELSISEFLRWEAWFEYKEKKRKEQERKQRNKSQGSAPPRPRRRRK